MLVELDRWVRHWLTGSIWTVFLRHWISLLSYLFEVLLESPESEDIQLEVIEKQIQTESSFIGHGYTRHQIQFYQDWSSTSWSFFPKAGFPPHGHKMAALSNWCLCFLSHVQGLWAQYLALLFNKCSNFWSNGTHLYHLLGWRNAMLWMD